MIQGTNSPSQINFSMVSGETNKIGVKAMRNPVKGLGTAVTGNRKREPRARMVRLRIVLGSCSRGGKVELAALFGTRYDIENENERVYNGFQCFFAKYTLLPRLQLIFIFRTGNLQKLRQLKSLQGANRRTVKLILVGVLFR